MCIRDRVQAEDGQTISVVGEEMTVMELQASSLNQFNIEKALLAGEKHELCFSQEELNKVLEDRESEGTQAREEAESLESSQDVYKRQLQYSETKENLS